MVNLLNLTINFLNYTQYTLNSSNDITFNTEKYVNLKTHISKDDQLICFECPPVYAFIFSHKVLIDNKPKTIIYFEVGFYTHIYEPFETGIKRFNDQIEKIYKSFPKKEKKREQDFELIKIRNLLIYDGHLTLPYIVENYKEDFCADICQKGNIQKIFKKKFFLFPGEEASINNLSIEKRNDGEKLVFICTNKPLELDKDKFSLYWLKNQMKSLVEEYKKEAPEKYKEGFRKYIENYYLNL